MRTLLLLLLLASVCPIIGCSSNEESEQKGSEPVVQTEQPAQKKASANEQSSPPEATTTHSTDTLPSVAEQSAPEPDNALADALQGDKTEEDEILVSTKTEENAPSDPAPISEPTETTTTIQLTETKAITPQDGNATAVVTETTETTIVVQEKTATPEKKLFEAAPGFKLPETLTADTAKAPNYPATPQVPETEETVERSFGIEKLQVSEESTPTKTETAASEKQEPKRTEKLSSSFGIEKPEPVQQPSPSVEEQKKAKAQAADKARLAEEKARQEKEKLEKAREQAKKIAAAKQKARSAAKTTKKKLFARTANIHEKNVEFLPTTANGPDAVKLDEAKDKFKTFAAQFIEKINRSYLHTPGSPKIVKENGKYKARYTELDKISVDLKIKQSKYDHTPFVGFMKYSEKVYESQGDTPDAAVSGSYRVLKSTNVTEIFRYAKGVWIE